MNNLKGRGRYEKVVIITLASAVIALTLAGCGSPSTSASNSSSTAFSSASTQNEASAQDYEISDQGDLDIVVTDFDESTIAFTATNSTDNESIQYLFNYITIGGTKYDLLDETATLPFTISVDGSNYPGIDLQAGDSSNVVISTDGSLDLSNVEINYDESDVINSTGQNYPLKDLTLSFILK